jgi:hypothetical protein
MKAAVADRPEGRRLLAVGGALLVALLLWDLPVVWPLKLLVVMVHETGHALASLLVGGSVDTITVRFDESGRCLSSLPRSYLAQVLVYSAGYVGSALAGAALLLATLRYQAGRGLLLLGAGWLTVMGALYARDLFTFAFCAVMAVALAVAGRKLPLGAIQLLNLFLAAFTSLYALFDLRDDLWSSPGGAVTDAALLAELTLIPAGISALLWTLLSLGALGGALYLSFRVR